MNILEKFLSVRKHSEDIVNNLEIEDFVPQSIFFASPPKWNLAHTSWFFEEFILKAYYPEYKVFHPKYSTLFNSYYQGAGERTARDQRGALSRPTVKEVFEYRAHVDAYMTRLISSELSNESENLVVLGINHEQQHQELFFTDHKYALSRNPLYPSYGDIPYAEQGRTDQEGWLDIEEGEYLIGHDGKGFCFDNELSRHKVFLPAYSLRKDLVRNGEFLEFLEDKGYHRFEFWHDEAWKWINNYSITSPLYWKKIDGEWYQYTFAGLRKINHLHLLTHISYYEAFAFAEWKGLRLPTEFEWEAASDKIKWGDRWEWTESAYLPYPGYNKLPGTIGEYNGKFMVNQKVLRGASVVTSPGHSRLTYRNFFHPDLSWQFNGIRLAK